MDQILARMVDGQPIPMTRREVEAMFPDIVFPATVDAQMRETLGLVEILPTTTEPQPATQTQSAGPPQWADGAWWTSWVVRDATPEELSERTTLRAQGFHRQNAERLDEELRKGVQYTFPSGKTGVIQTRPGSADLSNVNGLVTTAMLLQSKGVTQPVMDFRDEANVRHKLTPEQMAQMGLAVSSAIQALHTKKWAVGEQIDALTSPVQPFDIDAAWTV